MRHTLRDYRDFKNSIDHYHHLRTEENLTSLGSLNRKGEGWSFPAR
jgi:hypothetical protein